MRSVPVVSVKPDGQLAGAFAGVGIGPGVGPFAQRGLDEAVGLSVGSGRIGLGADVADLEALAGCGEVTRFVTGTVVGHDPLDHHAEAFVVSDGGLEEGDGA